MVRVIHTALLIILCAAMAQTIEGRTTIEGKSISGRFLALDSSDEPNSGDYGLYLAVLAVPFLVLAVLTLLCIPTFLILRCCCGCCGGRKPRPGLCCGRGREARVYTVRSILTTKGLAMLALLAVGITMVFAYAANSDVSQGTESAVAALAGNMRSVFASVSDIRTILLSLPASETSGARTEGAVDKGRDLVNLASDVEDLIDDFDLYRALALNLSYAIPALFLLAGTVLGLCAIRACGIHIWLAMLIALGVSILWISVAVHLVVFTVTDDLCTEVDTPANDRSLRDVLGCNNGTSNPFDELRAVQVEGRAATVSQTCNALVGSPSGLCLQPGVSGCPSTSSCDSVSLPAFEANVRVSPGALNISECATQCTDSSTRDPSETASTGLDDIRSYDALSDPIQDLQSCAYVDTTKAQLADGLCSLLTGGLETIYITQIVAGIVLSVGSCVLIRGQKRFLSSSYSAAAAVAAGGGAGAAAGAAMTPVSPVKGGWGDEEEGGNESALDDEYSYYDDV